MVNINDQLHLDATGLRLARYDAKDELLLYNTVLFSRGRAAVEVILRRAKIAGHVVVDGDIENHFADVMNNDGDLIQTIALDRGSFGYLNDKMRPGRDRV